MGGGGCTLRPRGRVWGVSEVRWGRGEGRGGRGKLRRLPLGSREGARW